MNFHSINQDTIFALALDDVNGETEAEYNNGFFAGDLEDMIDIFTTYISGLEEDENDGMLPMENIMKLYHAQKYLLDLKNMWIKNEDEINEDFTSHIQDENWKERTEIIDEKNKKIKEKNQKLNLLIRENYDLKKNQKKEKIKAFNLASSLRAYFEVPDDVLWAEMERRGLMAIAGDAVLVE